MLSRRCSFDPDPDPDTDYDSDPGPGSDTGSGSGCLCSAHPAAIGGDVSISLMLANHR